MKKLFTILNDQHWYIVAVILVIGFMIWIYGCQSQVASIMHPGQKVTRAELELESDYVIGQFRVKLADLDRQDAIKTLILEQAAIFGQTGTFNPTGLMNVGISIGAIAFGLNRNQKVRKITSEKNNA